MKTVFALSALCVALSLTACNKHHGTHAVEMLETAEAEAKAKAPAVKPLKFDDENAPKAGSTAAATDPAAAQSGDTAPADTKPEAAAANGDKVATDTKPNDTAAATETTTK